MIESHLRGMVLAQGGLALAALVFLGAGVRTALLERPMLEAQNSVLAQRLSTMKAAESQTDDAIQARDEQIKSAQIIETRYAAMLSELLELSKVDSDARAITQKWKIQSAQPAAPESHAPAAPVPQPTGQKPSAGPAPATRAKSQ